MPVGELVRWILTIACSLVALTVIGLIVRDVVWKIRDDRERK